MRVIVTEGPAPSPARVDPPARAPLRVGLVQHRWHPDPEQHTAALAEGVRAAATAGARVVCLMELTLSPYFAVDPRGPGHDVLGVAIAPEPLVGGPTHAFVTRLATEHGVAVHASLYEHADGSTLGYNTAICVDPHGELLAHTRKTHLPVTEGYHEDRWFLPGHDGYPPVSVEHATFGFPTCWDQWFPEVARAYSLGGADVLVYPTAIGSEPGHPDFDTQPLWERVITGNAIANGLHMIVVNRVGTEGPLEFYGSSFVCDPYGRVLARAPRDEPCALVVDLDLDARRDWLTLFPFLTTRRPDTYGPIVDLGAPEAHR
ncbi:MAG TPA: nitrilase-related carbon-nitrogen hydrolase [Acidimicrobiia bacterium]|nr:nitrilase-related carbon-nitrogen hydrolase [Acidimicrobiia bacterium]